MEKMKEKHITQRPITTPTWMIFDLSMFLLAVLATDKMSFWPGLVLKLLVVISAAIATVHMDVFLFGTELILSPDGIKTMGRIGTKQILWSDFIQAGTLTWDYTNVLVLVRRGGRTMKELTPKRWFVYGNPGKLVFLPDDKFTRAYVAAFYGSIDFERAEKEEDE